MQNERQTMNENMGANIHGQGDSELRERIMTAITSDSTIDASNITINMRENDMVEICGTVPTPSMVELVEECVRRVDGIKGEIDNDLKVRAN